MCEELGVSRSGYYAYEARKRNELSDPQEAKDYADFLMVRGVYEFRGRPKGSRQIAMLMPKLFGTSMNRKKMQRLMRKYDLECPIRRANPLRKIAKALQTNSVFSNKLNRQFAIGRPGEHLLTDISYLYYGPHGERRCYLSAIKDASTNEIVAWTLSETIDMPFVIAMLQKLDSVDWLPGTFLLHSDNGWEFSEAVNRNEKAPNARRYPNILETTCVEFGIIHKFIRPRTPEHNGKVERSHRIDQDKLYRNLKFYSLEDLRIQGKSWNKRYNSMPRFILNCKTPNEIEVELQEEFLRIRSKQGQKSPTSFES